VSRYSVLRPGAGALLAGAWVNAMTLALALTLVTACWPVVGAAQPAAKPEGAATTLAAPAALAPQEKPPAWGPQHRLDAEPVWAVSAIPAGVQAVPQERLLALRMGMSPEAVSGALGSPHSAVKSAAEAGEVWQYVVRDVAGNRAFIASLWFGNRGLWLASGRSRPVGKLAEMPFTAAPLVAIGADTAGNAGNAAGAGAAGAVADGVVGDKAAAQAAPAAGSVQAVAVASTASPTPVTLAVQSAPAASPVPPVSTVSAASAAPAASVAQAAPTASAIPVASAASVASPVSAASAAPAAPAAGVPLPTQIAPEPAPTAVASVAQGAPAPAVAPSAASAVPAAAAPVVVASVAPGASVSAVAAPPAGEAAPTVVSGTAPETFTLAPLVVQPAAQPVPYSSLPPVAVASASAKPASAARAPDLSLALREALDAWLGAWARQDVEAYIGQYAPGYAPPGRKRAEWERERRERLKQPVFIRVAAEEVSVQGGDSARPRMTFVQRYESERYEEKSRKVLTFVKQGGRWLIEKEENLRLAR